MKAVKLSIDNINWLMGYGISPNKAINALRVEFENVIKVKNTIEDFEKRISKLEHKDLNSSDDL